MEDSSDQQHSKQSDIYRRVRLLGTGSFGKAFQVVQISSGLPWVIKQIDLLDLTPTQQQQVMKQAKILQFLNHSNIIRFKQVYRTSRGKLNIVMEYAAGGDLSQQIKKAREQGHHFTEEQVLWWFVQVCLGLKHLHDSKVIHRDLKAQNIFLTKDNLVKIGDFGVAKVMEHTAARARTQVGSPYYLSPQIIQNRPYSFKTDIWSLGTLLFELCSLQPPFSAPTLPSLALKIVQGSYAQIPKQYSEELRTLVKRMLQTKESSRPNIHQVLLSPLLSKRISSGFSSPKAALSPSLQSHGLPPPPDLQILQNKSEFLEAEKQEESPQRSKAKTPQVGMKKGANNFFNRPPTGKRKQGRESNDLAALILIKPSVLQAPQKIEKVIVPLPKMPRTQSGFHQQGKPDSGLALEKKRVSVPQESNKEPALVNVKQNKKEKISRTSNERINNDKKGQNVEEGKKAEKQIKAPIKMVPKKIVRDNKEVKIKVQVGKQSARGKLEICSEELKKKEIEALSKKQPKKLQKTKSASRAIPKIKQESQKAVIVEEKEIMEEEKCESSHQNFEEYYEGASFQSYQSQSEQSSSQSAKQVELAFSETEQWRQSNNYLRMMAELDKLKEFIGGGELPESLPVEGQLIPELLQISSSPREDDDALEQFQATQEEMEGLRANLEDLFGEEDILYAFRVIEAKIQAQGYAIDEVATVKQILRGRPSIDEELLQAYFRLIVTMVAMERGLIG